MTKEYPQDRKIKRKSSFGVAFRQEVDNLCKASNKNFLTVVGTEETKI